MPKTDKFSNDDTKEFGGLYALLTRFSNSTLKADYYYDWLLSLDDRSHAIYREYLYHRRLRLGHDPRFHMSEESRLQFFESTKAVLKNFLAVFSAEATKELLTTAYEEIGRGSATEKLELILGYLNEVSSPKLRLVTNNDDFTIVEDSCAFKTLVYRIMYIFIGDYREDQSSHAVKKSDSERIEENSQFLIECMYSYQLSSDEIELIPIRFYTSGNRGGHAVSKALDAVLQYLPLEIRYEYRAIIGSWFGRFFGVIKNDAVKDELNDGYESLKRSLELQYLNKPQSEVDKNLIEAVSSLTQAAATQDVFVAQIGSLLFMKYPNGENKSQVFTRTLTQQDLIRLNQNQAALSSPDRVLALLQISNPEGISVVDPDDANEAGKKNA